MRVLFRSRHALCSSDAQAAFGNDCTPIDDTGNCNIIPGQALVGIGRRDVEGGPRTYDLRHTAYRMIIGAKGDLGEGWNYDLYAQYGTTIFAYFQDNEWSKTRVQRALQVDPATGQCFSAEDGTDPNCVPLDLFNGFGAPSAAALAYVKASGLSQGFTEEQVVSGNMTGDLGQYGLRSPWAKDGVGVNFGAEYRAEYLQLETDQTLQSGDLYGNGAKTLPQPKAGF